MAAYLKYGFLRSRVLVDTVVFSSILHSMVRSKLCLALATITTLPVSSCPCLAKMGWDQWVRGWMGAVLSHTVAFNSMKAMMCR